MPYHRYIGLKEQLDGLLTSLEESRSKLGIGRWDFLRINNGFPSLLDSRGKLPGDLGMGDLISLDKGVILVRKFMLEWIVGESLLNKC